MENNNCSDDKFNIFYEYLLLAKAKKLSDDWILIIN